MQIEIQDPTIEARLQKQLLATIDAKIRRGMEQLDRGEGILGDEAKQKLARRKAAWLSEHPNVKP